MKSPPWLSSRHEAKWKAAAGSAKGSFHSRCSGLDSGRATSHVRGGGAVFVMTLQPEHCLFDSGKLEFASSVEAVSDYSSSRHVRRSAGDERPRRVLMWSDDADEALAVTVVLRQSGILVDCHQERETLERELLAGHCDGVILSPATFDTAPDEIIFHLRKISERPNLTVTVIASQMSDDIFRRLAELDRVSVLITPINYAMLAAAFGA